MQELQFERYAIRMLINCILAIKPVLAFPGIFYKTPNTSRLASRGKQTKPDHPTAV